MYHDSCWKLIPRVMSRRFLESYWLELKNTSSLSETGEAKRSQDCRRRTSSKLYTAKSAPL